MIKSPLRYPGGKSRAVALISSLIPEFKEYREPFIGGGSVFIHLKQKFPLRNYWVNDVYYELYAFWKNSQTDVEEVIKQVEDWRRTFATGKELHKYLTENITSFDDLRKAAAFFVFNRITFSGTTESGGYSEQAFHGRFTDSSIERLRGFAKTIQQTTITHLDYQKVVEAEGDDVFLFLDPPYYSATQSALYGKNGKLHKTFDHDRFAKVMQNCQHPWLITYDDCPHIRERFDFAHIHAWDLTYGMRNITEGSDQKGKKLFISNYLERLPTESQLALFEEMAI